MGTPLYMSPEQAVSRPAAPSSDLYSLASVAYHCLTGRPVFEVENIAAASGALGHQATAPLEQAPARRDRGTRSLVPQGIGQGSRAAIRVSPRTAETFTSASGTNGDSSGTFSFPHRRQNASVGTGGNSHHLQHLASARPSSSLNPSFTQSPSRSSAQASTDPNPGDTLLTSAQAPT